MLRKDGVFGLVSTNTIAQGDTREVGLNQILSEGCVIRRAISSQKWPGDATVEISYVWIIKSVWCGQVVLNGYDAKGIDSYLTESTRHDAEVYRLFKHPFDAYIGLFVNGIGFVVDQKEAACLIERDHRNRDVLIPYLNGQDINSTPDQSTSRWIIYFRDWPLTRDSSHIVEAERAPQGYIGPVAEDYPLCLQVIRERVKPTRDKLPDYKKRVRDQWWLFEHIAPALEEAVKGLERLLVRSRVANINSIVFIKKGF